MSTEHARLAPSSAHIWVNCPGSTRATEALPPQEETDDTREGDAAHWLAATRLSAWREGTPMVAPTTAPNGVILTDEIWEGASLMVDEVLDTCQARAMLHTLHIEERVEMSESVHAENWGTPDAWAYDDTDGTLYLWDFKYGHRYVEVVENWQLINYAAGLIHRLEPKRVVFRIVQPRCYYARSKVREWRATIDVLYFLIEDLRSAANAALGPDPDMGSGKHCRDCRARALCPVARHATAVFFDSQPYNMHAVPGASLAAEREHLKVGLDVAKARLDALEDEITHRIKRGDTDTGYALESVPGKLEWSVPAAQAIAFVGLFDVDASKQGVITPTQALQKIPKELRDGAKEALAQVTKRDTSFTLTPVADSRSARAFQPTPSQE